MANAHGHFVWYELTTTDVGAAKAFYTDVVSWGTRDASAPGAPYTLFTAGDTAVCGLLRLADGVPSHWTGYVSVDDVDATVSHVRRLGGAVYISPMNVPDISRFSVIADPQQATLAVVKWQYPVQDVPAISSAAGHVGWHELFAANWQTAFAFYSELFGWHKVDAAAGGVGTYQVFSVGGQPIGGMSTKPHLVPVPYWLFYFNVSDIDAAAARVQAGGGKILEGPAQAQGGNRIAHCEDPQGAIFALAGPGRGKTVGYFAPRPSAN